MPVSASFLNCNYSPGLIHCASALFPLCCRAALHHADYSQSNKFCKRKFNESSRERRQQDVASQRPLMECEVLIMCVRATPAHFLIGRRQEWRALSVTDDMLVESHHVIYTVMDAYEEMEGLARPPRQTSHWMEAALILSNGNGFSKPVARGHSQTFASLKSFLLSHGCLRCDLTPSFV